LLGQVFKTWQFWGHGHHGDKRRLSLELQQLAQQVTASNAIWFQQHLVGMSPGIFRCDERALQMDARHKALLMEALKPCQGCPQVISMQAGQRSGDVCSTAMS